MWSTRARVAPRRGRPRYLGPDPTEIEVALRRRLDLARTSSGLDALLADDRLAQLARHRAHARAAAAVAPRDRDDRTAASLRRALTPSLAGPLEERCAEVTDTEVDADLVAGRAVEPLARAWASPAWTAGAIGVGVAGVGMVPGAPAGAFVIHVCAVVARRCAELGERTAVAVRDGVPAGEGPVELRGRWREGCAPGGHEPLTVRAPDGEGVPAEITTDPAGFCLTLSVARPGRHRVVVGGVEIFSFDVS